jgi:hypothetical protein
MLEHLLAVEAGHLVEQYIHFSSGLHRPDQEDFLMLRT